MKKIYIHPNASDKFFSFNPYIGNLCKALQPYCKVVNHNTKSNAGILHLLKFLPKIDYVWFNWIEDLPDKRKGYLQTLILLFVVFYCKIASIKIVWTLHNKFSHYKKNAAIKRFLFWFLMKQSDFVLTHSTEGVDFAGTFGKKARAKTKFMHHPFPGSYTTSTKPKTTDILIWGSIIPYKGIDHFLDHLWAKKLDHKWNIRVIGKIPDEWYKERIMTFANEKITIENKFIDSHILRQEIESSKCVLYTYLSGSVLSSGALMDSIAMGAYVIGPRCGAFNDLKADGIIDTYSTYDELTALLETLDENASQHNRATVGNFVANNSWENFGKKVADWLL